jgi:hypothetical protein
MWHVHLTQSSQLQAMDGSLNLEQALERRLEIINCTPSDIKRFVAQYPPESRLVPVGHRGTMAVVVVFIVSACSGMPLGNELPKNQNCNAVAMSSCGMLISVEAFSAACLVGLQGIQELISALQARGTAVYLISGGFRYGRFKQGSWIWYGQLVPPIPLHLRK